jgi:hypothetical protein
MVEQSGGFSSADIRFGVVIRAEAACAGSGMELSRGHVMVTSL